jgi:predicted RNA-binding Zn-ribbon protein involved in translation (DUF1610 family)
MKKNMKAEKKCACPYCDEEIKNANLPFCQSCGVVIRRCGHCHVIIKDDGIHTCPECGKSLD